MINVHIKPIAQFNLIELPCSVPCQCFV